MTHCAKMGHRQKTANTLDKMPAAGKMKSHSLKRRPGRPKKTETISGDKEQLFLASRIICSPKSPGRPKKQSPQSIIDCTTTKKRRGRPKKEASPTEKENPSKSTKKRPGRPKKTTSQSNEGSLFVDNMIKSAKRGPGRPKKKALQIEVECSLKNKMECTKRGPGRPKKNALQPNERQPFVHNVIMSAKRGRGCPKNCTPQTREEAKNEPDSIRWNDVNCKQVKEEPAEPDAHGICCVTKFGNWEFEGLEAFVKGEGDPSLTGHYEEEPQAEAVQSNTTPPPQETPDFHSCPYCTISFTEPGFLQQHVKYHHRDEHYDIVRRVSSRYQSSKCSPVLDCTLCGATYQTLMQLTVHKKQAHPSAPPRKLFTCPVCACSFDYLKNLRNHCQSWHNMSVHIFKGHLRCSDCRRSFRKSWGQGPHECVGRKTKTRFAHPEYTKPKSLVIGVNCQECGKILVNLTSLRKHMLLHTGEKPYACKECGKAFADSSTLWKHMNIHTGSQPYECDVCKKRFSEKSILRRHKVIHTGETPYACSECGKTFGFRSSLNKHKQTHLQSVVRFSCLECDKSFSSQDKLKYHQRIHRKMYQCIECGLRVASLQVLKVHTRSHTGERPYHCNVCNKRFKRLEHLYNHQRTHTGERPYKCDQCEGSFMQSGDLLKHKRRHSGDKPYVCTVCNRRFICKGSLKTHSAIHSDARPHKCEICAKMFRLKSNLNAHKKIHSGDRPYQCPDCDGCFKRSEHLNIHLGRCLGRKS